MAAEHDDFKARIDAYMLRTCSADGTSRNGFIWPTEGYVEAPDWDPEPVCGGGLHGLAWGEGRAGLLCWDDCARWQVVGYISTEAVDVTEDGGGKIKIPRGWVVPQDGTRLGATAEIIRLGARGAVHGSTATAGYRGTATAGDRGTATAGYSGTATAGDSGTATAGYRGTATAGDSGTATAGDRGTATAGYSGTATAGYRGTATAGDRGTILLRYWDGARYRMAVGYVGENGIEAGVAYRCDDSGRLVKAQ